MPTISGFLPAAVSHFWSYFVYLELTKGIEKARPIGWPGLWLLFSSGRCFVLNRLQLAGIDLEMVIVSQ